MKRQIFKVMLLCIAAFSVISVPVSAASNTQEFQSYTINDGTIMAIPQTYVYGYSINTVPIAGEISYFSQPSDIFVDQQGFVYVADTKNNRVVKMTTSGEFIAEFSDFGSGRLNQPEGVYVTEDGRIYIADTGNSQIVELDSGGALIRTFGMPKSELLSDVTAYSPSKIVVSPMGEIYVLMGENIMSITEDNEFIEYFGKSDVGFNFTEWILRLFASKEQQKSMTKRNAASYTNICLDRSGLIYAVSLDTTEGQIKVLNSVGNNIYRKLGSASGGWAAVTDFMNKTFSGNIIGKSFIYGERGEKNRNPEFSDICVNNEGIVTVIERHTGKLYQYDALGNLLCVFGGNGVYQGELSIPVSIATDRDGNLYVLDSSYGNITVFKPTDFVRLVQQATVAYSNGDYDQANTLWSEVLTLDKTYPLAHLGIGNTQLKERDYGAAMESYKLSGDRKEYSNAFSKYRDVIVTDHFGIVALCSMVTVVLLGMLILIAAKKSAKVLEGFEYNRISEIRCGNGLLMAVGMLFRPGRTLEAIKDGRGRIRHLAPIVILIAVFATRLLFIYTVSYPLQDIELNKVNLVLEFIKLMLPVLSWIGMNYLISEQFSGEATLGEAFITAAFSMVPYIVINLFAAAVSHLMCWQEKGVFALMVNGVILWCVFLLLKACRRMNDYTIRKTIFVSLITVVAMVLLWFICLFGYSLVMCLKEFFADIVQEIQLMRS